ncbi:hypothetical protein RKD48_003585 [Streptomyces ambofaciens]
MHVLILGGTTEARRLAELLAAAPAGPAGRAGPVPELRVTNSLAGRVAAPRTPPGELRVGGFGGAEGLAAWLRAHTVDLLVDATHPFAGTIPFHAAHAAATARVPLLALRRPGWRRGEGDVWHEAGSLTEAAALLPGLGRRIFLTTGRTGPWPPSRSWPSRGSSSGPSTRPRRPARPAWRSCWTAAPSPSTGSASCCAGTGSTSWSPRTAGEPPRHRS